MFVEATTFVERSLWVVFHQVGGLQNEQSLLLTQTCFNCKRKWFVGLFECFFLDKYLQKYCGQMALWHKNTVFPDRFDQYCLMSINYFLRNEVRNSQKQTFARRQWAQNLLFLFFTQHLFQSFWLIMFDVNQLFSQKWSSKLSKTNFCSKTVGTVFAVFVLHSTSFQINLVIIVWC